MAKFKARPKATKYGKRHIPGQQNQTEALYADEFLEPQKRAGIIDEYWFEAYTFKLAPDCRYTPDWGILYTDGTMEFVDTKGSQPIDPKSLVKIKVAAEKFPQFKFTIEQRQTKKNGGGWKRREL